MVKKILVVDDTPEVLRSTKRMVAKAGYDVLTADCAIEAMIIMEQKGNTIDAIITDLEMPIMTGEMLVRQLRDDGWEIPMFIYTGNSTFTTGHPCAGVFRKPAESQKLLEAVKNALQ